MPMAPSKSSSVDMMTVVFVAGVRVRLERDQDVKSSPAHSPDRCLLEVKEEEETSARKLV